MKRTRVFVILAVISFAAVAAIGVLLYYRPPLRVMKIGANVHVDVQTLGEYPTDVVRVRLIDIRTGGVVWDVRSHGAAQLSTFDLNAGENSVAISHVAWGRFDVVTPTRPTFTIERRHPYLLEVWGTHLAVTRNRTQFAL